MTSIKPSALLKGQGLPDYDKITPDEINKNIPKLIQSSSGLLAIQQERCIHLCQIQIIFIWQETWVEL